jgi:hypothetical protein
MSSSFSLPNRAILSAEERAMIAQYVVEDVEQRPLAQVASVTGIHPRILYALVYDGVLSGFTAASDYDGVCDSAAAHEVAQRLNGARAAVEGHAITANDAAEKYGFSADTIYNWHNAGWVTKLHGGRRNRLFNEGDIAFARALADLRGQAAGKSIFPAKPRSGRPRKK